MWLMLTLMLNLNLIPNVFLTVIFKRWCGPQRKVLRLPCVLWTAQSLQFWPCALWKKESGRLFVIMGANAKRFRAHILLLCGIIIFPFPPWNFGALLVPHRWSDQDKKHIAAFAAIRNSVGGERTVNSDKQLIWLKCVKKIVSVRSSCNG